MTWLEERTVAPDARRVPIGLALAEYSLKRRAADHPQKTANSIFQAMEKSTRAGRKRTFSNRLPPEADPAENLNGDLMDRPLILMFS